MILNYEEIKRITVGAMDIWKEADGVHFSKFTKEQLERWAPLEPHVYVNAKASTGVRLDFHTDSSFITVKTSEGAKYEVLVDGKDLYQFKKTDDSPVEFTVQFTNGKTMKRVMLVLPCHDAGGVIRSLELEDGATVEPHTFDRKILFIGDSITQGWNSKFDCQSFAYLVSDFLNAESVIQGVGSAKFEPSVVVKGDFDPEIVFVAFGTNDYYTFKTMEELEWRARGFFKNIRATYPDAKMFAITPVWRMDLDVKYPMGSFEDCCNLLKRLAKEAGLFVIDGDDMIPRDEAFMADFLHPNDLGFHAYARNILRNILGKI